MPYQVVAVIVLAMSVAGVDETFPVIELSDLQAVTTSGPPYIFRLPFRLHPGHQPYVPAVMVRRPGDVLSLVRPDVIEIHLRTLTDVELEISHSGQTLNRFFPTAELQAARSRLQARLARERDHLAKSIGQELGHGGSRWHEAQRPQPAGDRSAPLPTHRTPPHLEQAQGQPLSATSGQVAPAAATSVLEGTLPQGPTPLPVGERVRLEAEMLALRDNIYGSVAAVVPWGSSVPVEAAAEATMTGMLGVGLGGLGVVALASLCVGIVLRRQGLGYARQCQRLCAVMLASAEVAALHGPPPRLPAARASATALGQNPDGSPAVPPRRRLRVLYRVRRRIRLRLAAPCSREGAAQDLVSGPLSRSAAVFAALGRLRRARRHRQPSLPLSAASAPVDQVDRQVLPYDKA
jgi:hypothetical protein